MDDFAKLYRAADLGQVLITKSMHTVNVRFVHPDGRQMCQLKSELPDTELGWEKATELFSMLDEDFALRMVRDLLKDENFEKLTYIAKGTMDA
jgi:hypothetical protein